MIDNGLKNKKDCMGCHACSSVCPQGCISMETDSEGFWYPKVAHNKCTQCRLCIKVCPIINNKIVNNELSAYACINEDEEIRLESSSGGMFTLIAEQIIDKGGIIFGAGFNEEFEVEHYFVAKTDSLWKLRGSKYVQSKIGDSYQQAKDFLDLDSKVLFIGTPCQIAGLKGYLGKPYSNLLTIDFICHGVPSAVVWRKYVAFRETEAGAPAQRIAFRRKDEGWKRYSVSFLFENNSEYRQTLDKDLYMRAFLKDVCLRPSCYDCKFKGLNRQSDITLADFWGIQNLLPDMDDDKGASLIFINSDKGRSMLEKIKDKIIYREVDINEAVKYNTAAIKSANYNSKRDRFFQELDKLSFDQLINKYCADSLSVQLKRKIKNAIGKIRY